MEMIVVILIIGILATLGLTHYGAYKEKTLDREAQANLRLIIAAERIYRMEISRYFPYDGGTVTAIETAGGINPNLRLSLTEQNWDYATVSVVGLTNTACGLATRVNGPDTRTWRLRNIGETEPVANGTCP